MKCELCNDEIINGIGFYYEGFICDKCFKLLKTVFIKNGKIQPDGEFIDFVKD